MAALAAVPLAHQATRPIRAAEVLGAMNELVHDAGGPVIGAHELLAAGAADGFVPANGLVGFALAVHHAFKAETTLALGGAGVTPNRMRGAHHLAANAARAEAGAAGVADLRVDDVVALVVRDRIDRAGLFAGVAADADLGVDQVLLDQHDFGNVHDRMMRSFN